ncbi:restriction endonuclease subunit S [Vibrio parahaemolyticus]
MSCNWPLKRISEVANFENNKRIPLKSLDREKRQGIYPYYGASGVVDYIDDFIFDGRYLLISEDGENLRTRNTPIAFQASGKFWVNNHAHILSEKEEGILDYLEYYFSVLNIGAYITGAVQPKLNKANLDKIEIPIPPKGERLKLNNILNSLKYKVALNSETNQTLEEMAQAIFKSWFVDFDPVKAKINGEPPKGMDAATASLFPEKLVESEEGMIPEGWSVEPLKNISRVINGRAYKNTEFKEEGTPIIRIQNLTGKGKTVYSDMELPEDKLVEHGDLIFAWSATFGPHLWRGPKSIYHYHIWKMDVDETKFGKYLLYLHLARLTDYLKNQGTGSIFTHLTKGIMESQKLVIPNESVVEAFSKVVTPLFAQIDSLHKENKILEQLRDTLLPKLLSGEIELGTSEELVEAI